jgi:hypothetical protein
LRERGRREILAVGKRRWWEDEERDHVDGCYKLTSKITLNEYKYIENRRAI